MAPRTVNPAPRQAALVALALAAGLGLRGVYDDFRESQYLERIFPNAEAFVAELDRCQGPEERDRVFRRLATAGPEGQLDLKTDDGVPLLCWLVAQGRTQEVARLLVSDPLPTGTDRQGRNALHYAAVSPRSSAVWALAGIGPWLAQARDRHGDTPLHLAASQPGAAGNVIAMLAYLPNRTEKNNDGETPLHVLVRSREDLVDGAVMALASPGMLDTLDAQGRTAMLLAAEMGKPEVAAWLSERGADPNIEDRQGRTARETMLEKWPERAAELRKAWAHNGFEEGWARIVLSRPLPADPHRRTGLHRAADAGDWSEVERLSRAGANPNKHDARGRTARETIQAENPALYDRLLSVWDEFCYETEWAEANQPAPKSR